MAETKYSLGHSRKPKGRVGVGGKPVLSWDDGIELQPTSSSGSATAAQNTSLSSKDNRHVVAQTWATKQAFAKRKEREPSFGTLLSKNAPVKVSVSGEWALQECEEFTNWANNLLKKGRNRAISDIRKSVGDGQTLVHILEVLAGEKIPGVYARPVTRAQKLENLQLCMSFMGNRSINLQGIYVGDLIDGNLNSILSLCGNLRKKYEGSRAGTPDTKRPHSSDSLKQSSRSMNGLVNHSTKDYDGDANRPHGTSSGYHSEEYSPTRAASSMGLEMPGMMADPHSPPERGLHPNDVIVSTTKLDRKAVYQSGYEQRKNLNLPNSQPYQEDNTDVISPSVEERLRSLLNTPNPGGLEEETDDELMIPPPRRRSDLQHDESFDVEERLKSLLDGAVDGFSEDAEDDDYDDIGNDSRKADAVRELDAIGYMPSHPSEKMRNISPTRDRKDSFSGRHKRNAKPSTPPALRRAQHARAGSSDRGTGERTRKISVTKGPGMHLTRTAALSELPKAKQTSLTGQTSQRIKSDREKPVDQSPADRRSSSHSDFLRQVASRLANEVGQRETTTASSTSISPADTPMLPALSPSSSIASFVMSSDSSGTATPVRSHSSKNKIDYRSSRNDNRGSGSSTPRRRNRGKGSKTRSASDLDTIKTQIESLESMYADVLCLLDEGVQQGKTKSKDKNAAVNQQKTEELKAGIIAFRKQRSKDIKAVNKRFGRLESHVVTLARSVAHLSSELRSQAAVNEDMDVLKEEIKRLRSLQEDMNLRKSSGMQQSDQYAMNLKRVNKLRKFFGSEPPLLDNFLKKLGYERFAAKFGAEQIGILELPYLNEERLQSLGIPLGPRLRIVEEANRLQF